VDLASSALVGDAYGKAIVSADKCNKCHDALGTTFHNPNYGSAGVVACRICHTVRDGGAHLEMQSRSIDSYVHAIHSMQPFDIQKIDFSDPVASMRYDHHVESTYPNFTLLNCESCHNPNTYEVPDQFRTLPGVLSAAQTITGKDRAIGTVPSIVTGPGARACGSCHRAEMINEDAAGDLASFGAHTATFGFAIENGTGVFDEAVAKIMAIFK
jgi:OmcA/MtrC family decaheme c-type cytochrome